MGTTVESMVSEIRAKIANETEKAMVARFRDTFGESIEDHVQEIEKGVFPSFMEPNVLIHEEYKYQDRVFMRVKVVLDHTSETKYVIKIN